MEKIFYNRLRYKFYSIEETKYYLWQNKTKQKPIKKSLRKGGEIIKMHIFGIILSCLKHILQLLCTMLCRNFLLISAQIIPCNYPIHYWAVPDNVIYCIGPGGVLLALYPTVNTIEKRAVNKLALNINQQSTVYIKIGA